jgi:HAMP domain-containing protein/CheY-like chemotaxis protein/signal transduction histidine kinase
MAVRRNAQNSTPTVARAAAKAPAAKAPVAKTARATSTLPSSFSDSEKVYTNEQLEPLLRALEAARDGNFSSRLPVPRAGSKGDGALRDLHATFNDLMRLNDGTARELVRIGKIAGREGRLTERANLPDAGGSWSEGIESVNELIQNLARPTNEIARVITAVAQGDLSQKMALEVDGTPLKGEFLRIRNTVNTMVDQLSSFADEVTRVAREVGTEGKLGGQANVKGVSGTWKDLTDNVNFMAGNLTTQVRGIAKVVTAVANGDLNQKLTVEAKGEVAALAETINSMTDTLSIFADQVTTVAREVGTEGILGGQAKVPNAAGTWKDLTDNVNFMAGNLTTQVRGIARVVTSVADGDLKQKLVLDAKGEVAALAETINSMTDTLSIFADQVTTVAREVGTEGKLGGQAKVPNAAGTWKDLTDNVNFMASNLTSQVRNIALVTTAVANGDLSQKITVDARGEILELKSTVNVMVDQLNSFAAEVTRVAREVGTEGKLGGQAEVPGVSGTWKGLTDNVNFMASNLTSQVRNIALVTTAVANGDLSRKITVDVKGEILELKNTVNVMVDQLNSFAAEVTRVAREVGTEGKLGGQANVPGVAGTWKDLTDNVNFMARNLTDQVRGIVKVVTAVANGELNQKLTVEAKGEVAALAETINSMTDTLSIFADQVTTVAREVGTEGKLGGQAKVPNAAGTWKDLTDNVNFMAGNLTTQVRGIARVVTSVADGDLKQKLVLDAKGEVAALAETINSMTDTLSTFADQVTTVAREVGTEGKLGGQAKVPNAAGTWKDLTDNVNFMAGNLTTQVRGIVKVVTAVADGDLKQKLTVEAKGEVAALAETINSMTDTLSTFADQVTTVAREVGTEGKLGGQAAVPGVSGTWKDLTDNVNFMANSLTVQVRSISDVATAVAKGDLTQTITVDAQGEVSELKDNINLMIANLKETTQVNTEQDWLKTNLARFSRLMQGQKNLADVGGLIMSELTPLVSAHHGAFYINDYESTNVVLKLLASYAYRERKSVANRFHPGEGLVGQCALEKKSIILSRVPGDYIQISSGLGEAPPLTIIVLPVLFEGEIMAVIELASFQHFSAIHTTFLDQLMESIGVVLNMISANMRTEELLVQSQSLTQELQSQSEELQGQQEQLKRTNLELGEQANELEEKATLLEIQNQRVEQKNHEVELARAALEEKAAQLALSSKYKSEFLANMSHELRTPLNSMLILAKLLSDNMDGNLSGKQVEFASTIHASGGDLLALINEILDLSKVESGKMEIDVAEVPFPEVREYIERSFNQVAQQKELDFIVNLGHDLPISIRTDAGRLQQVLKNLLSNAFKFTESGRVALDITLEETTIAFAVTDTGIGIARDKQNLIFEAFQQADGTTSRRYGGTGLGLSISREIARLLGGHLSVSSTLGEGSVFTLHLPLDSSGVEEYSEQALVDYDLASGTGERAAGALVPDPGSHLVWDGIAIPNDSRGAILDDRDQIGASDRVVLIIEDDEAFARILFDIAKRHDFKVLVAMQGEEGLRMARQYRPDAISLDLQLPLIDGWTVLDALKRDPNTRHIPVQVISVVDRGPGSSSAITVGAIAYLEKPVSREALEGAFSHISDFIERAVRHLLIVEDDEVQRQELVATISEGDLKVEAVSSAEEALAALETQIFDCMILDLGLPGMSGFDLLRKIKKQERYRDLPVIIHTSQDLTKRQELQLKKYAATILTKDPASPAKLLQETTLFLHRVVERGQAEAADELLRAAVSEPSRPRVQLDDTDDASEIDLGTTTALIVDDDIRNIFALTSLLENQGVTVLYADNGADALTLLQDSSGSAVDLVLMDIMMPGMDGYATTRAMRRIAVGASLPIIALTAKAMAGDREKCLQAGASDYITKPVDIEKLLPMMRRWVKWRKGLTP